MRLRFLRKKKHKKKQKKNCGHVRNYMYNSDLTHIKKTIVLQRHFTYTETQNLSKDLETTTQLQLLKE